MRTDALLRRVAGLDRTTLDACVEAGWVTPDRLTGGGEDPRWWSDADLNRLRDVVRLRRAGMTLEVAWETARQDPFFGLCPCDWRLGQEGGGA